MNKRIAKITIKNIRPFGVDYFLAIGTALDGLFLWN